MEGSVTSTAPVTFAIEIFLDYADTDISKSSHLIRLNIGEFFDESQAFFKHVKIILPASWCFNTTILPGDFPKIFYEDDTLMNITYQQSLDSPQLANHLRVDGLTIERYVKPSNGGNHIPDGNGNGEDNGDEDDGFFLDTYQLIAVIAIIAVIAVAGAAFYLKRKKDQE